MSSFMGKIWDVFIYVTIWLRNAASLIRSQPFLLFTVGFIALVYVIVILGRLLSNG